MSILIPETLTTTMKNISIKKMWGREGGGGEVSAVNCAELFSFEINVQNQKMKANHAILFFFSLTVAKIFSH